MSDIPPPLPAEPPDPPGNPPSPASPPDGCLFAGGVIAGFILFLAGGWTSLMLGRNGAVAVPYLFVAGIGAIWLATKPGYRGLAIGILLGLGAVLLLVAICGGMHI